MFDNFILDFVVPHFNAKSHLWLFRNVVVRTNGTFVVQQRNGSVEIFFLAGCCRLLVIIGVFVNFNEKAAILHGT
jgi:hypothetical protein